MVAFVWTHFFMWSKNVWIWTLGFTGEVNCCLCVCAGGKRHFEREKIVNMDQSHSTVIGHSWYIHLEHPEKERNHWCTNKQTWKRSAEPRKQQQLITATLWDLWKKNLKTSISVICCLIFVFCFQNQTSYILTNLNISGKNKIISHLSRYKGVCMLCLYTCTCFRQDSLRSRA